jgi:ABC-2 type transport system ATP-binding protein
MYGIKAALARQRSRQLLDNLGLAEKANKLVRTLSGGMQRRMNLAMALVHDPEIVILDEPEAGLDPQSHVKVRD